MIHGLSLCSGIGGLDLGLKLALGESYRTVCYVEREAYAAAVLVARMEDQALDLAPVWDDVESFTGGPWRGVVDLVSAGFPCPPFSSAGKRAGADDERWLWPELVRIISDVRPSLVFLENVPGLLNGRGERNRCVCGWAGGRGGLNHNSARHIKGDPTVRAVFGHRNGSGQVRQCSEPAAQNVRGACDGEQMPVIGACCDGGVASSRPTCGMCACGDPSCVEREAGSGDSDVGVDGLGVEPSSHAERQEAVDRRAAVTLGEGLLPDAEPQRTRGPADEGFCSACGRPLDDEAPGGSVRGSALGDVLWSLAALGFDAEWLVLPAAALGAPHLRKRLFLLAYSGRQHGELLERGVWTEPSGGGEPLAYAQRQRRSRDGLHEREQPDVADPTRIREREPYHQAQTLGVVWARAHASGRRIDVADADSRLQGAGWGGNPGGWRDASECGDLMADTHGPGEQRWGASGGLAGPGGGAEDLRSEREWGGDAPDGSLGPFPPNPGDSTEWARILAARPDLAPAVEPRLRGLADGLAPRVDRLRASGNGVVPVVAAAAFLTLAARLGLEMTGLASEEVLA